MGNKRHLPEIDPQASAPVVDRSLASQSSMIWVSVRTEGLGINTEALESVASDLPLSLLVADASAMPRIRLDPETLTL